MGIGDPRMPIVLDRKDLEVPAQPTVDRYCRAMPGWVLHLIGNIGVVMILGAYFLVSTGRIRSISSVYQGLNLLGAIIIAVYSVILAAWASVVLNSTWAVIAAVSLIVNLRKARANSTAEVAAVAPQKAAS